VTSRNVGAATGREGGDVGWWRALLPRSGSVSADAPDGLPAARLTAFSDGVVAIAITLLVLPLVDLVPQAVALHESSITMMRTHTPQFLSFALSFAVIARFWFLHHAMFSNLEMVEPRTNKINMLWLATIVVLPFPTEMVGQFHDDRFTALVYVSTLAVSMGVLSVLAGQVGRDSHAANGRARGGVLISTIAVFGSLVLLLTFPELSYRVLLLMLVPPLIERILLLARLPIRGSH
jgi:uncharacterized membrane protein